MPKYIYFCKECKKTFETKHSLRKTCTICKICDKEGELERQPAGFFLSKKEANLAGKSRPGEVVKATIEAAKEDLKLDQSRLKQRKYKSHE